MNVVLLLALAASLIACRPTPAAHSTTPAPPGQSHVAFRGEDSGQTATFELAGGSYSVRWKANSTAGFNRMCTAGLGDPKTGYTGKTLFDATVNGRKEGSNQVYGVEPGVYYVSVIGCGTWSIELNAA